MRYQRAIGNAVATIKRNLHFSSDQTERLEHLLREATRPPRRFGAASDRALINRQLARLPEEKVRPIFDDEQWQTVLRWMAPYKRAPAHRTRSNSTGLSLTRMAINRIRCPPPI